MYKISTITMNTKLPYDNVELNLYNIWKYLNIDDFIKGMKYNNEIKGFYNTRTKSTKSFYNQVNLIIYYDNHYINVKLFSNGSLHFSGCKLVSDGGNVTKKIVYLLTDLSKRTENIILIRNLHGILIDSKKYIYSNKYKQIIGHIENDIYYIKRKQYIIDNKYSNLLRCKNIEKTRLYRLIDFDGDNAGYVQIKLINNKKKFYKNNNIIYDYENCIVLYKDFILGFIDYNINTDINFRDNYNEDIINTVFSCNPFIINDTFNNDYDININSINISFDIGFNIDRYCFYDILVNNKYICKYNPDSYCGINLTYKNNDDNNGLCSCLNKCICSNITFLIFHSGKVISAGYTKIQQIEKIYNNFIKLCNDNKEKIKI